jgi:monofunctional biosynthetic peptidoglycan transglycosylase
MPVKPGRGTARAKARPDTERYRDMLRNLARLVAWLVLGMAALIVALGLAYRAVTPVSTLMLGRRLAGRPVMREAVPLEAIAPALPLAVIVSEDARFCRHKGVDWGALRTVLDEADEDGPSRGASTIAMQTAKNLFLWPSRSYLRKGLEIPIALYLDLIWPKRRLIEVYLNIAEWGDGVFGAEAAARRYFGKRARDLDRREAALLATALPNPLARNPARPSSRHLALAGRLSARLDRVASLADCLRR